jgi:hypothetical protein
MSFNELTRKLTNIPQHSTDYAAWVDQFYQVLQVDLDQAVTTDELSSSQLQTIAHKLLQLLTLEIDVPGMQFPERIVELIVTHSSWQFLRCWLLQNVNGVDVSLLLNHLEDRYQNHQEC